ncbi:A disintegrin and metalloproteinase with thrombospondin motifs 10-like [Centruroides sculpturatus]|uniref:A disintegrin and metalloproteinase with thrombospondin motifs 10-like n=1 Tax=Centruroides sculpturatus TaxID=218467 RepID=UPI000C6E0A14|nr:A disintegrin and metalloproteinase with thrombospondin motifs 10-like [Centruroides sculpturatus]
MSKRNRTVLCMNSNMTRELNPSECPGEKPSIISECPKSLCISNRWFKSSWGKCNVTCGHGFQMRMVECRSLKREPSDLCLENTKPSILRACYIPCKKEECTDANKVGYCQLVVKLQFCNRHYFSKMCCKSCSQKKLIQ